MKDNSLVSIIVPVYKVENELPKCIESIIKQTYSNIEIILVDDGSPDNCPKLCDDYAIKDARIKVLHKKNGGLSDARNAGLEKASGNWILFVDSDDYLEFDAVEQFIKTINSTSEIIDIVVGVIREISLNGNVSYQRHTNLETNKIYSSEEYILKSAKYKQFFAPACLNLYRKDFLKEIGQGFKVGIYYEDLDFIPKVFLSAKKIIYNDYPFYNYIKRENSITNSKNYERIQESAKIVLQDLFDEINNVQNKKLKKTLYRWISNIYLWMLGYLGITKPIFPKGMGKLFLLRNSLNFKDFIKTIILIFSQNGYIHLYKGLSK